MTVRIQNFINGSSVDPANGQWLDNVEPATGSVYGSIPDSTAADVDAAVDAARAAFPDWSALAPAERSAWLDRLADAVERNLDPLARAESIDTGKPIALARSVDIPRAAANLRFFARAILHTRTDAFSSPDTGFNYTRREPRGVAGCISPWNLPLYLFTWKIAPALATGNTVVGKPSEVTPVTAAMLGDLAREIDFPPGVLNIVHGRGPTVGAAIVEHPDIPAISFTGGTETGKAIARSAGPMFKRISLELGGKNANIIFNDADLERAVKTSVHAAFANQGQICLCGSRIFIHRDIYDDFTEQFVAQAGQRRIGDPLDDSTQHGAVVSEGHMQKVLAAIDRARQEGGEVLLGGSAVDTNALPERCQGGYFVPPTIITGLDHACCTNQEEIFGPVVTLIPFDDETIVIEQANSTPYGLAAILWTRDLDRAHRVAAQLDAGIIWINCWLVRDLRTPFGGMKQSGVGREGGDEALRFFTEPKNICIWSGAAP